MRASDGGRLAPTTTSEERTMQNASTTPPVVWTLERLDLCEREAESGLLGLFWSEADAIDAAISIAAQLWEPGSDEMLADLRRDLGIDLSDSGYGDRHSCPDGDTLWILCAMRVQGAQPTTTSEG